MGGGDALVLDEKRGEPALKVVELRIASLGSTYYGKHGVSEGTSRSRTPAKLQYEPRVDILQRGYEYAPLNTAWWPDWLPTETRF